MVPRGDDPAAANAPTWVFPFDKPLSPGEGDNQAMAVNTTDGTIVYDTAFALVWVEDGAAALNTNEAFAFASCTGVWRGGDRLPGGARRRREPHGGARRTSPERSTTTASGA